jgi:hypothetical protein
MVQRNTEQRRYRNATWLLMPRICSLHPFVSIQTTKKRPYEDKTGTLVLRGQCSGECQTAHGPCISPRLLNLIFSLLRAVQLHKAEGWSLALDIAVQLLAYKSCLIMSCSLYRLLNLTLLQRALCPLHPSSFSRRHHRRHHQSPRRRTCLLACLAWDCLVLVSLCQSTSRLADPAPHSSSPP